MSLIVVLLLWTASQLWAGPRYVVLDPGLSAETQIQAANCTYEIRDDFKLSGKTLTLPDNCTLVFRGGSLQDCSVVFRNTYLDGNVRISLGKDCCAKGRLQNETVYTSWFKAELVQLLNSLIPDNQHKTFIVANGTYTICEPLIVRNISGLILDFNGSVLCDQTQGENATLHRPNPMIWIRASSNVTIRNFDYRVSAKRYFSKTETGVIFIGACSQDWDNDTFNITISGINGKGSLIRRVRDGLSANAFICGLGNINNIELHNIQYEGDLSSLCNFEYGLSPGTSASYVRRYGIKLPDYYGLHPYNLRISNITGRNAPSCQGFVRLSSCYNAIVENCYGYNVNSLIYLYSGDMSINRVNGSAIVRNCASYVNKEYRGTELSGLLIFNVYYDPASLTKHSGDIEHNLSYQIENCEFQGLDGISGCGLRVSGGDGNIVFNNVTIKNYSLAAKLSGTKIKSKVGGLVFNNCLFENNSSSVEIYGVDNCVFNACIFRNKSKHLNNRIADNQIAVYSGVQGFTLRDCIFEEKNKDNRASFVCFEQKKKVDAVIDNCRFIGSKVIAPVIVPESVSLSNCIIE